MVKVLTIANRKGGAGKSTCAAHIALEACKHGLKTLLIDLDPQKTLENWWNLRDEGEPYMADVTAADVFEKIKQVDEKGFDLCIIDTPGDTSPNAVVGIKAADLVVIPSRPTSPDLRAIGRTISMVKEAGKPYIFVVAQAISRSNAALQAASVLSEFGPVAPSTISHRIAYANAMTVGGTAALGDKIAAEEIDAVWKFISNRLFNKAGKGNGKEKI
jgi:chromosome partitioning protein